MTISDQDQVNKLKTGDRKVFDTLYTMYYSRIFKFTNSYVRDSFVAGNIVQDSFVALWENRERLTEQTNVPAYLLTIVRNNALNHLNRVKTKMKVEENIQHHFMQDLDLRCATLNACNPEQLFCSDIEDIIRKTMDSLSTQGRKAILLSRFEGLSNKEIAQELKISLKGVEFHVTKALKILRENLKDYLTLLIILLIDLNTWN